VVDDFCVYAGLCRPLQAVCIGTVTDNSADINRQLVIRMTMGSGEAAAFMGV
jgi:hypothetical protein